MMANLYDYQMIEGQRQNEIMQAATQWRRVTEAQNPLGRRGLMSMLFGR